MQGGPVRKRPLQQIGSEARLRLGCFEALPAARRGRAVGEPRKGVPLAPAPVPVQLHEDEAILSDGDEVQGSHASDEPSRLLKAGVETAEQRRAREYFKGYFGELCGPDNRILLEGELGRGSFSSVFKCKDTRGLGKEYAVKFIRANKVLQKATEREIKLMRRLRSEASEKDPEGAQSFLALAGVETFEHEGHLALVFHLQLCDMRTALYGALGQDRDQGCQFSLPEVRSFGRNIFMALRALRCIRIIHNDLKPDNLLLSLDRKSVKLSDFGIAVDLTDTSKKNHFRPTYCSSYRPPEVTLGQPYSTRVDMWSAGATLFEIAANRPLLTSRSNNGLLHDLLQIAGPFPKRLATSGKVAGRHFTVEGAFKHRLDARIGAEERVEVLDMKRFRRPSRSILEELRLPLGAWRCSRC